MERGCLFEPRPPDTHLHGGARASAATGFFGWLETIHPRLLEDLAEFGGILFRGFLEGSRAELERFNEATGLAEPCAYRGGYSPRGRGRKGVYHSTFLDPRFPIPLHCELSYLRRTHRATSAFSARRARS